MGCPACIGPEIVGGYSPPSGPPEAGIGVIAEGTAQKKPAARKALALDVLEAIGVTAIH